MFYVMLGVHTTYDKAICESQHHKGTSTNTKSQPITYHRIYSLYYENCLSNRLKQINSNSLTMAPRTETLPRRSVVQRQTQKATGTINSFSLVDRLQQFYNDAIDSAAILVTKNEFVPNKKYLIPLVIFALIGFVLIDTNIDVSAFESISILSIVPEKEKVALLSCDNDPGKPATCSINFKQSNFAFCYYVSSGLSLGEQIDNAITKQLLSNYFKGCSADFPMYNLAVKSDREKRDSDNIKCLFTSGSMMNLAKPGDHIWGTGITPDRHIDTTHNIFAKLAIAPNLVIHAVRGPLTWDLFETYQKETSVHVDHPRMIYGDPRILVTSLFPHLFTQTKKSDSTLRQFCVIPHVGDFLNSPLLTELKGYASQVSIISPSESWEQVASKIAKDCSYVASTSLYGLILAESLGIPTFWYQEKNRIVSRIDGTFKYNDFYDSIGVNGISPAVDGLGIANITNIKSYRKPISASKLALYAKGMISSFPYDLFEQRCVTTPLLQESK